MAKRTATHRLPDGVRFMCTFEDASGAPALIDVTSRHDGRTYTFAADLLGEQTLRCLTTTGTARGAKAAAAKARALYARAIAAQLSPDYLARNRALYADILAGGPAA